MFFAKYKTSGPMVSCPCCSRPEETNVLFAKKIKLLTVEDFGRYPHKAITTWGDKNYFKYLLPRMLELEVYKEPYSFYYIPEKFEISRFDEWPDIEKQAIADAVLSCIVNGY